LRFYGACVGIGLLALPLCGAAVTFFAAAKKVTKESSFFKQQFAYGNARAIRSGPTGGVSLAEFHRCWHVEEARTSHHYREWTSNHSSVLGTSCPTTGLPGGGELKHAASISIAIAMDSGFA
jgi:hypothetical protein